MEPLDLVRVESIVWFAAEYLRLSKTLIFFFKFEFTVSRLPPNIEAGAVDSIEGSPDS